MSEKRNIGDMLAGGVKWLGREAIMPAAEKLIPQGAAEVTQALFTGNGYVPYGPAQQPLEVDMPGGATDRTAAEAAITPEPAATPTSEPIQAPQEQSQAIQPPDKGVDAHLEGYGQSIPRKGQSKGMER